MDLHHAAPILNNTSGIGFHVPLSSHPCGKILNQAYGLKAITKEVAEDTFDPVKFHSTLKIRILDTFPYLLTHLKEEDNFDKLNRAVLTNKLNTKDLIQLLTAATDCYDIRLKKLGLFVYSLVLIDQRN